MNAGRGTEIEWKLAVVAEDPARLLQSWRDASTSLLGEAGRAFRLGEPMERSQCDLYLDSSDRRLSAAGVALRIRKASHSDTPLVTLKAAAESDAQGCVRRPEVEFASKDPAADVNRVRRTLSAWGIDVPSSFSADEPEAGPSAIVDELVRQLGYVRIQERTTVRVVRSIHASTAESSQGGTLGELVLDTVRFPAGDRVAVHREIEIEAEDQAAAELLGDFVAALCESARGELVPFARNKLRLGFDIEEAARKGELARHLDEQGNLLPSFYKELGRQHRAT